MQRIYSLAYLTTAPMSPPDVLALAQKLGYQAIGVRLGPFSPGGDFSPLVEDTKLLRETISQVADSGVSVFDVEIVRLDPSFRVEGFHALLETAGKLGARAILVVGDDPDPARLTSSYAAFCDAAAAFGLTADLEFIPWTAVPDAKTALRIVSGADRPNGRILVDALHAARSTTTLADIAAIPRGRLSYGQLCDAPAAVPKTTEGLIHTARCARLLPGDGGIDLPGIVRQLPPDLPISIEIPNEEWLPKLGAEEWARRALAATKHIIASAE